MCTNLADLTAALQQNQERLISSIELTSTSLSSLTEKVDNNQGTLGRLVNDPKLYDNLSQTSAKLDTLMLKINNAEGTLGLFVNDTTMYSEMTN